MKKVRLFVALAFAACLWTACSEKGLDPSSIFATETSQKNEFDTWLEKNYTKPYNIEFKYRFEDNESDLKYNVTPAAYENSISLAKLVKYLWLDAYEELAGSDFIRKYCPKEMFLVGSPELNSNGTMVLGTAEGGLKVVLFNVNGFDPKKPDTEVLNRWYFETMHHEFSHILHQTKNYPIEFGLISAGKYTGSGWVNLESETKANQLGFVSRYASSEIQEDFVETIAMYITSSDQAWNKLLLGAGENGKGIILQKWGIVKDWLADAWGIDLVKLHKIVKEREKKIASLDLETLKGE